MHEVAGEESGPGDLSAFDAHDQVRDWLRRIENRIAYPPGDGSLVECPSGITATDCTLSPYSDFRLVAGTNRWHVSSMMIRTAIYARTSPDCPLSLEEQIERLRTVAAERGMDDHKRIQRPPDDGEEGSGSSSRRIGADRGDPVALDRANSPSGPSIELGNPSSSWSASWKFAGVRCFAVGGRK